jgi:pyruvate dehydrogenase E2 component (dihydrolipoamide acetyltransferase)
MTRANELLARKREFKDGPHLTLSDIVVRICASALLQHPALNARFAKDALLLPASVNVGITLATPNGLVVPVVRDVHRMSLREIAEAREELVMLARTDVLRPSDIEDGTFTISNLGMYGIDEFAALLIPPQVAILAVGSVAARPVVEDSEIVIRQMATLTLTVDHRAVDGAEAALFLQAVRLLLEEPGLAL